MAKDYSSIVVSSRVRLSRCLNDVPFPAKMDELTGKKVVRKVYNAIDGEDDFGLYVMKDLPRDEAYIMQEKHLISHDLIENSQSGAVMINQDETISIMINEEDHIREQCLMSGLCLEQAYQKLNKIDQQICKKIDIAFDQNLGFLTSCITNVGTGLRVSVMLFLPALTLTKKIDSIIGNLTKNGLAVRGAYGEATDYLGYLYQISNERTIGKSEEDYIRQINSIIIQICDMEIDARKQLLLTRETEVKDVVGRAYGVLTNCYLLPVEEFMRLAGEIKMGIALNLVRMKDNHIVDKLLATLAPYTLCKLAGNVSTMQEEQKFRAEYVAKVLKSNRIK
ncbi:MAG: ATP--guanido phosphotransferase [Clostridia bacterium]|nr:ATP--guanido phosphotransferase [Clostridia bacterium]